MLSTFYDRSLRFLAYCPFGSLWQFKSSEYPFAVCSLSMKTHLAHDNQNKPNFDSVYKSSSFFEGRLSILFSLTVVSFFPPKTSIMSQNKFHLNQHTRGILRFFLFGLSSSLHDWV